MNVYFNSVFYIYLQRNSIEIILIFCDLVVSLTGLL